MADYNRQKMYKADNMTTVSARFSNEFVKEFKESCAVKNVSQSDVIRNAMKETIVEAKFKLTSLNTDEKNLLLSICELHVNIYKQEVTDEASKKYIDLLRLTSAIGHYSACSSMIEVIEDGCDEFNMGFTYIASLVEILHREWEKAELEKRFTINSITDKLGIANVF